MLDMTLATLALLTLAQTADLSIGTSTPSATPIETPPPPAESPPAEPPREEAPKPKPPPYSLPFQLRAAGVGDGFRFESVIAFYDRPDGAAKTIASYAAFAMKLHDNVGVLARFGFVSDDLNGPDNTGGAFMNPALGVVYAKPLPYDLRFAATLLGVLPFGSGGGDRPEPSSKRARVAGIPARSAFDNATFAPNDLTIAPSVDLAWVKGGFTAQLEATVFFLFRQRGELDQPDERKINLTSGLHLGYFLTKWVSVGGELRLQRWLEEPRAVKNAMNRDALLSQLSFAIGPRFHIDLGGGRWLRPAIVYARGIDDPMSAASYNVVQIDVPFAF